MPDILDSQGYCLFISYDIAIIIVNLLSPPHYTCKSMFQGVASKGSSKAHYLPFAAELTQLTHISRFRGQTAGIDIFHWINQAIHRPVTDQTQYLRPQAFLDPIYQKIALLRHYNITPVFVFDGWAVPKKLPEILRRYWMRSKKRREAHQLLNQAAELSLYWEALNQEQEENLVFDGMGDLGAQGGQLGQQLMQLGQYPMQQEPQNSQDISIQQEPLGLQIFPEAQQSLGQNPIQETINKENEVLVEVDKIIFQNIMQPQQDFSQPEQPLNQPQKMINQPQKLPSQPEETLQSHNIQQVIRRVGEELEATRTKGQRLLAQSTGLSEYNVRTTMKALKGLGYDFIVAPYEADYQLVKFKLQGKIDFVISQDGDYVIHGVPLLCKLKPNGDCDFLDIAAYKNSDKLLTISPELRQYTTMSAEERAEVAALAGTDYFRGVGACIKTVVKKYAQCNKSLQQTFRKLRLEKAYMHKLDGQHERHALEVKMILLHQMVFDSDIGSIDYLHPFFPTQAFTEEQLQQLVRPHYDYSEEIKNGHRHLRQPYAERDLTPLPPPETITLDTAALEEALQKEKDKAGPTFKESKSQQTSKKSGKRASKDEHNEIKPEKHKPIHKPKEKAQRSSQQKKEGHLQTYKQKQLQKAAVGCESILSFFKKKPTKLEAISDDGKAGHPEEPIMQTQLMFVHQLQTASSFIQYFVSWNEQDP